MRKTNKSKGGSHLRVLTKNRSFFLTEYVRRFDIGVYEEKRIIHKLYGYRQLNNLKEKIITASELETIHNLLCLRFGEEVISKKIEEINAIRSIASVSIHEKFSCSMKRVYHIHFTGIKGNVISIGKEGIIVKWEETGFMAKDIFNWHEVGYLMNED